MPPCRAAPARRIRATPPWPDIRGCSWRIRPSLQSVILRCERSEPRRMRPRRPSFLFAQIGSDLLAGFDQRLHRLRGFLEHTARGAVELDLDDALDALGADHYRHTDVKILDAVFAVEPGGR